MKTAPLARAAALAALAVALAACSSSSPYRSATPDRRDPAQAARLTLRAADLLESDPARAETLLREALALDLFHGPAHNNLGVVHLARGELYEAATEFEWARKLMPGHPDPRVNLALALEAAGRTDEALDTYRAALESTPAYLPAVQGLARLQVRAARTDAGTSKLLATIALEGETPEWRDWARLTRARLAPRPADEPP